MLVPGTQCIQYSYIFQNDHHGKSSYHLSPCKDIYIIIDNIPHLVHFISMTHLFCNWKFVPLNFPLLFLSSPHSPPLWQPPVCSLYLWVSFCFVMFVHLFCFLDSTYKWSHTVFGFLWLISLSIIPSMSIYPFCHKWQYFILSLWLIYIYISHLLYPFVYWWAHRLFPYLAYCK